MFQTHALSIKWLMHFLPINKHISILHVCSTKTAKIKHWSLVSPGKVASWIFPLQMKSMLLLQIKALCSPLPCLTVPCKCVRDVGWVLPQHLTAFERIKPSQHTQHHGYPEPRGAFRLTTSKTLCRRHSPLSIQGSRCSGSTASSFFGGPCNLTVLMEKHCSSSSIPA